MRVVAIHKNVVFRVILENLDNFIFIHELREQVCTLPSLIRDLG